MCDCLLFGGPRLIPRCGGVAEEGPGGGGGGGHCPRPQQDGPAGGGNCHTVSHQWNIIITVTGPLF